MNQLEVDVAMWLVSNQDGLKEKTHTHHNVAYQLLPDTLFDIYLDSYKNRVISNLQKEVSESFSVTPEDVSIILTEDFITQFLGEKFLKPIGE